MRTFSFGAGVQSTAVLVLQAQGKLPEPYDVFLFANVGDDSEDPRSLEYFHEHHVPFAKKHGIELIEVQKHSRAGEKQTLMSQLMKPESRSLPIPVRMSNGAPGRRSCTADFKIHVIRKWQRQHGSSRDNIAVCGLGISVDEIQRARTDSGFDDQVLEYPLLDLGLWRKDCYDIIEAAGLPKPPKSACFFCPFHDLNAWRELKRNLPEEFEKSCQLEETLNIRREKLGKDHVWLTRWAAPLRQVIDDQLVLDLNDDGPEGCDSGSCFT